MSRVVTYLTFRASDANMSSRTLWSMLLLMDMIRSGARNSRYRDEARICADYALESPNMIPAGACEQIEIETGDEENGLPGYCVSATQVVIERDAL